MVDAAPDDAPKGLTDAEIESYAQAAEASPEDVAPETPAPEAGQAPAPDATTPRYDKGRFAKRTPAPEQPSEAPAAEPPSEPSTVAAEAVEPTAYYRADGQSVEIPGSALGSDGVFISRQSWPQVQQLLSKGHGFHQKLAERDREVRHWKQQAEAAQAARTQIVAKLTDLAKRPDEAKAWWENFQQHAPQLLADAKAAETQHLLAARDAELAELRQAEQDRQLRPRLEGELEHLLGQYLGQDTYQGVDAQRIWRRLSRQMDRVFLLADYDDPEGRWRQGEIVVNYGLIEEELRDELELAQKYKRGAADAVKESERQTATSKAPKTVTATGPAPSAEPKRPKVKTRADAEKLIDYYLEHAEEIVSQ